MYTHPTRITNVEEFLGSHRHVEAIDTLADQRSEFIAAYRRSPSDATEVYFVPWRNALVQLLAAPDYELLLAARSRFLFTEQNLASISKARVGIAGLSVGSRVLEPLAHGPALCELRLADADIVSATGLGRQPFNISDLGTPKAVVAARIVSEVRPRASITLYEEGLNQSNLNQFLAGLDIVVDAMDDPRMKLMLRESAAKSRVDVIMGTDVEEGIIDFEPFRTDSDYPVFHGQVSERTLELLRSTKEPGPHLIRAIAEIVGLESLTLEGLEMAVALITNRLGSMSQLATTSTIVGGTVARMIHLRLAGRPVKVGRTILGIERQLVEFEPERKATMAAMIKDLMSALTGSRQPSAGRAS